MFIKYNFYLKAVVFVLSCSLFTNCSKLTQTNQSSIDTIVELHKKAITTTNDSTLLYLKKATIEINDLKLSPDSLLIDNLYLKGDFFRKTKILDSASYYYHKAIDIIDSKNISNNHLKYFRDTWDNDSQLELYSNATSVANKYIKIFKDNKTKGNIEYAYFFLGQLNNELKNSKKEDFYYKIALKEAKFSKNNSMINTITLAIAKKIHATNSKKAYEFIDHLIVQNNSDNENRNLYHTYGVLKFFDNEFKISIANYKKEIYFIKKNPNAKYFNYNMTYGYANIAEAYIQLKDIENAEIYLDSADNYLNANSDSNEFAFVGQQKISLNYLKKGSIEDTQMFFNEMVDIQNRAYEDKIEEEVFALKSSNAKQKLFAEQKQEAEIKNLKLQSRNLVLSILATLIGLIGYLVYRQRKIKFEKHSLQMQQRLLRSQMNPHFISNTLYAIQNTIQKDQESSVNYLVKFSRLLRLILENSMQNYVLLEKELESLHKYLDLQLLRFPDKFKYNIILNDVEDDIISIPPMLLQPFVENCIEHGFMNIDYIGDIKINLSYKKNYLFCVIEDNGAGLSKNNHLKKQSTSLKLISDFILKATKTKISILNKKNSNPLESGTRIEFLIPYKILDHD